MTPEKFLGHIFRPIGQERDPEEIFLARKFNGVIEQFGTVTVSLKFFMHHQILQQHNEAAFRRANGEKQVDHPDDRAVASKNEDAPAAWLFENQTQPAKLFVFVRAKIALLLE